MAANRFMPAIWSPCAGSEKAGGPPSWVSASSRPERAKNAVEFEARLLGVGTGLAVARHRGIDQARVERRHVLVAHAQPRAHLQREVHHHDVGGPGQPLEHRAALGVLEVEHDRPLVAVGHVPAEIDGMLRHRMGLAQLALRIALARRLDLDDLGAIVAHHRGRHRAGDEARQIEHPKPFQRQMPAH